MMHKDWVPFFLDGTTDLPEFDLDFKRKVNEDYINKLVKFLKVALNKRKKLEYDNIVVGCSGGLDSTIAMHLLKKALPGNSTAIYIRFDNSDEDMSFVKKISTKLNMPLIIIDAEEIYRAHLLLSHKNNIIAKTHLRSRLAVSIIFQYAENTNALVIDTTDKSERVLHLHEGSTRGNISLLKNIYRSEIHDLADFFGIPELKDKPSGCKDLINSEVLGVPLHKIDPLLYLINGKKISYDELVQDYPRISKKWLKSLYRRINSQSLRTKTVGTKI